MKNAQAWTTPALSVHGSVESVTGDIPGMFECEEGTKKFGTADSCTLDGLDGVSGSLLG